MTAHRVQVTVQPGGNVELKNLPFRPGELVEVLVRPSDGPEAAERVAEPSQEEQQRFPLRGAKPYRFDDPFSPAVPEEEWDALR